MEYKVGDFLYNDTVQYLIKVLSVNGATFRYKAYNMNFKQLMQDNIIHITPVSYRQQTGWKVYKSNFENRELVW